MSNISLASLAVDNNQGTIAFTWNSGQCQTIAISKLRGMCPCASCQGHGNLPKFIPNTVKTIKKSEFVGRYAISFIFGDGHSTGIYSWDFLRQVADLH